MTAPDPEEPTAAEGAPPFASLSALKNGHEELLTTASDRSHGVGDTILSFIERARSTGALLKPVEARREAQQIIDYWAAEMFGLPGEEEIDIGRLRLAPYDPDQAREQGPHADDVELEKRRERERQIVRLAASARMARDADWSAGYLLTGDALDRAKPLAADDESIRELVEKSDAFERRQERAEAKRKNQVIAMLAAMLMVAVLVAAVAWWRGDQLAEQNKIIKEQRASIEAEKSELLKAIAENEQDRRLAIETRRQRDQLEINLNAATRAFSDLLKSGALKREQVPPEILKTLDQTPVDPLAEPDRSNFEGYSEKFLGPALPLPKLGEAASAAAFGDGAPLRYVNYSVVMNERRKMAFFTASNLDRERRLALPRSNDRFRPDLRLPADAQPGESWFQGNEFDRGHLVTRQEIAWGPDFDGPADEAAEKALALVDVYPNVTPQYDVFNRGAWSGLERWVLENHNPSANRVTIFAGPVLSDTDPDVNGVRAPRAFWKIAVSRRVDTQSELVVDAFFLPQAVQDGAKLPEFVFDPARFRFSVAEIEGMTGIDFGETLRVAGNVAPLGTRAKSPTIAMLSAEAQKVDSLDQDVAERAARRLGAAVRSGSLPESELHDVVATLVYRVQNAAIWTLTQRGRQDLLAVLASIPAATWKAPGWSRLRADARRAAGDIERSAGNGSSVLDAGTREALTALERNVGLLPPPTNRVDFQFAGMRRVEAVEISARLKALGWKVPGEERTASADGVNEVRYGADADRAAADELAADLRALGLAKVTAARQNADIKPGNLEIWVSR